MSKPTNFIDAALNIIDADIEINGKTDSNNMDTNEDTNKTSKSHKSDKDEKRAADQRTSPVAVVAPPAQLMQSIPSAQSAPLSPYLQYAHAVNYGERKPRGREVLQKLSKAEISQLLLDATPTAFSLGNKIAQYEVFTLFNNRCVSGTGEEWHVQPKCATSYLEMSAKQGFSLAEYQLGKKYELGDKPYLVEDISKAIEWYSLAAQHGNVEAQGILGDIYSLERYKENNSYKNKIEVEKIYNMDKAISYYKMAIEQKDVVSMLSLARLYDKGDKIAQDKTKAKELMEQIIKLHTITHSKWEALHWLALECIGVSKYKEAVEYLEKSSKMDSLLLLASLYEEGKGVNKDPARAFNLYHRVAITYKHKPAFLKVGFAYLLGNGVKKNIEEAYRNLANGCFEGNTLAEYYLGIMNDADFQDIPNVTKDNKRAIFWYRRVIERNDDLKYVNLCKCYLVDIYFNGRGVPKDQQMAYNLIMSIVNSDRNGLEKEKVSDFCITRVMVQARLAYLYENGIIVANNVHKALDLYEESLVILEKQDKAEKEHLSVIAQMFGVISEESLKKKIAEIKDPLKSHVGVLCKCNTTRLQTLNKETQVFGDKLKKLLSIANSGSNGVTTDDKEGNEKNRIEISTTVKRDPNMGSDIVAENYHQNSVEISILQSKIKEYSEQLLKLKSLKSASSSSKSSPVTTAVVGTPEDDSGTAAEDKKNRGLKRK